MANNPITPVGVVRYRDMQNLRDVRGIQLEVLFDASHPLPDFRDAHPGKLCKIPHFDIAIGVTREVLEALCTQRTQETFYKFGFGTRLVEGIRTGRRSAASIKYEVYAYEADMIRRSRQKYEIERQLQIVYSGGVGTMVRNVH